MNPCITEEMILTSSKIEEFSLLMSNFECNLCPLREEAWALNQHSFPIPNNYKNQFHSKIDLVFIGNSLREKDGEIGAPFSSEYAKTISPFLKIFNKKNYLFMNICMCQPEKGYSPTQKQQEACKPFLFKQLSLTKPNVLVLFGIKTAKSLLKFSKTTSMKEYIEKQNKGLVQNFVLPHSKKQIPCLVAYHPAYANRQRGNGLVPEYLNKHYKDVFNMANKIAQRYK